jgi:hypothetical protein
VSLYGDPGRLVAFVHDNLDSGLIVYAEGATLLDELRSSGWDISGHNLPTPDSWRLLTHWEMCRVRFGLTPWDEQTKREEG